MIKVMIFLHYSNICLSLINFHFVKRARIAGSIICSLKPNQCATRSIRFLLVFVRNQQNMLATVSPVNGSNHYLL